MISNPEFIRKIIQEEVRKIIEEGHNHDGNNSIKINPNNLLGVLASSGGNFKVGNGTRVTGDGTGDQAITGVGFTPKCIIVFANATGTGSTDGGFSMGFATGPSNEGCLARYNLGSGWLHTLNTAVILSTRDTSNNHGDAELKSLDADGFTLTWTVMDRSVNLTYLAIG